MAYLVLYNLLSNLSIFLCICISVLDILYIFTWPYELCHCLAEIVLYFILCDFLSILLIVLCVCISILGIRYMFMLPYELVFIWLVSCLVVCIFIFCSKSTSSHFQLLWPDNNADLLLIIWVAIDLFNGNRSIWLVFCLVVYFFILCGKSPLLQL